MRGQVAGQVPRVAEIIACVVYHARTGRIAHFHRNVRFEGGDPVSKDAVEATALEMAARHHGAGSFQALHLTDQELDLDPAVEYAVDPQTKRLTQLQRVQVLRPSTAARRMPRWLGYFLAALLGALVGLGLYHLMA